MRYLKKFNEELKPSTYRSAADSLQRMGHKKRASNIRDWSDTIEKMESHQYRINLWEGIKRKNLIKSISSIGEFDIEINIGNYDSTTQNYDTKKIGQFYLYLSLVKDILYTQLYGWRYFGECWLPLDLGIVPANPESEEILKISKDTGDNWEMISLNLTIPYSEVTDNQLYEFGIKKPINIDDLEDQMFPSGKLRFLRSVPPFIDRKNAIKFKKALIDIFEGNVDYGSTPENPDGLKDEIMDELNTLTMENILRFIDSIKKINVNDLYKN